MRSVFPGNFDQRARRAIGPATGNLRVRLLGCSLLLFVCGLAACDVPEPPVRDGVLDLREKSSFQDAGTIRLDGEWEFYWGRFLHTDEREKAIGRTLVPVPGNWSRYRIDGAGLPGFGYASYRMRILLDEPRDGLGILIPDVSTAYRLFVNGVLVSARGEAGPGPESSRPYRPRAFSQPFALERDNEIVLEASNFELHEGGIRSSLTLGPYSELARDRQIGSLFVVAVAGSMFFMALYHLLLFGLEPRERAALFFAAMCLFMCLRILMLNHNPLWEMFPDFDYSLNIRLVLIAPFGMLPSCSLFLHYLFPGLFDKRAIVFFSLGPLCLILFVFATPVDAAFRYTVPVFGAMLLLASIYGIIFLIRGTREGRPNAGLMLVTFAWVIPFALNDWLFAMRLVNTGHYAEYGFLVFVFTQAFAVSRRLIISRRLSETLARNLERSNAQLRSLDKLKDEFLAVTSHELRTPLQGIIGIAGSIRDSARTSHEELDRRLDLIVSSGRRLADLVGEILEFSSLRYGELRLHPTAIDLHAFARRQLTLIEYNLEPGQTLELKSEIPRDLPPVHADEARLTQIFQNLLGNAVKHTREGGITVTARMLDPATIEIRIRDTGPGIPAERLERIFLPFEHGDGARPGGIGLGLSIARALTEQHGGTLRAESGPGKGSSFIITLPRSHANPEIAVRGEGEEQSLDPERLTPLTLPGIQSPARVHSGAKDAVAAAGDSELPLLLLVDDEAINLEVMRTYLDDSARVIATRDPNEVQELLQRGPTPDCLVLDLMMPVSGFAVMDELRRTYSPIHLPILVVTAMTRTVDLLEALELGANDYLTKPFEKEEFLLRVSNLTTLSRAHRGQQKAVREAARHERERINADLHDHLGAALTDLKIMSDRAARDPGLDAAFTGHLKDKVAAAIRILREDMLDLEDHELLEENFLEGLQLIFLRRYVEAGRRFIMQIPDDTADLVAPEVAPVLLTVLKEVVTNDLKYGEGPATLRFERDRQDGRSLKILFESLSNYRLESHGTGRGTGGMLRRLGAIDGSLRIQMDGDATAVSRPVRIDIQVPGA